MSKERAVRISRIASQTRNLRRGVTALSAAVILWSATAPADDRAQARKPEPVSIELSVLGTYHTDIFDASAAEIVAHDPGTQRLFVVNAAAATVEVLDISDPTTPDKVFELAASGIPAADGSTIDAGAVANSVSVRGDGIVAVAIEAAERMDDGWVAFFDVDGTPLNALRVGTLPDMLTFTPDGRTLLVANEGEPNDAFTVDPEGSVSVIDVTGPVETLGQSHVRTADFRAWDSPEKTLHPDVRIFGPDLSTGEPGTPGRIARNLEPEYIVADESSSTAWVILQEANAVAVLDIASATFVDIWPFGYKDHLLPGNELDVSDRDGEIRIANWPVYGMYQPDGFAAYRWNGQTLLVTANEGDSRDWDGYSEQSRFRALSSEVPLCEDSPRLQAFLADNELGVVTVSDLRENENMGRLNVTTENGLRADGSCYEGIYAFGARSFSIWTADGEQLYDSGSEFERIIADALPEHFNSNHRENSFKTRSDDKGPEPEDVAIGKVAGRTYAFIGLERVGGVMVYDVTDPHTPFFVQYLNNRDFAAEPGTREAGDLGPEGLIFIEAQDSPIGVPLLAVANEVSGTTTLFRIDAVPVGNAIFEDRFEQGGASWPPDVPNTGTPLPYKVLATEGGVEIRNGGFGSATCAHPTNNDEFYALTDRGPNADAEGGKYFPVPDYTPRIGHFRLNPDGSVEKLNETLLKDPSGAPISGRPNPEGLGATGEIPYDLNDNVLEFDPYGLDTEGLVAMKDGTFWTSDEYGPHITHFSADGVQLERISPVGINTGNRHLPAVFAKRWANRGMEGLAITPDESTLVGIMQSRLYNPSRDEAINHTLTRIVTFDLATGATKQYLYRQEQDNSSNSEITALNDTEFLVIERDGKFSADGKVMKHINRIDISQATDVSGDDMNAENGLMVNGKTLEANTWEELTAANIVPVEKTLAVDVHDYLGDYTHDKLEGMWLINQNTIGILNDDDFSIWSDPETKIREKTLSPDNGTERDSTRLYIVKF